MALPLKEKAPALYGVLENKWVASIIIAVSGIFLARSGGYNILWPAFSGANQLIASIVMLTAAIWVKNKLNPKYTNVVLIPAIFLWVTVTVALIWYEIVIIPTFFVKMEDTMKVITGSVVGTINVIMLILNVVMIVSFMKNFSGKKENA